MPNEKAILAGGCFWGMQELFRHQPGVVSTRVGYSGGDVPNATYRNHGTHAESIEVIYDPEKTDFRALLEFFFQVHDPSTKNRQGNDIGTSYRSAIFYTTDEQKRIAEDTTADVDASGLWPGKVVTEITPADDFWEAEPEHQDYLQKHPHGYTCHFPRPGWKLPKRATRPSGKARRRKSTIRRLQMSIQKPVLTPPNGGETVTSSGGSSFELKVESTQSGGDYGAVLWTVRAGEEPPLHTHSREDELVYVVQGQLLAQVGDARVEVGPGAYAALPRGVPHTIEVVGDQATLLLSFVPGGLERFLVPRDGEQPDPAAFGLTFP